MVIGLMLDEGIATVAVKKGKRKIKSVKRYDLPDSVDQSGVLKDPQMLGKELLLALKKDKITPTKLVVSVQCKDLVVTEVAIPVVSKKLLLQMIRLALQKSFPGVLENNYFAYKIYGMEDGQYQTMVAMMPKEIAQSYCQLAFSMKCRLERIDIHPNVLVKALKLYYGQESPEKQLMVDLQNTVSQLYYVESGIIQFSNSSSWRSGLGITEIPNEALGGLCRNIEGILSTVSSDKLTDVYLYDRQLLSEENIKYLTERLSCEYSLTLHTFTEMTSNAVEQLMRGLLWDEKLWSGDLNFALELDISDSRNYTPFEAGLAVFVGLAITVLGGNAVYGFYVQKNNNSLQSAVTADKNFIESHKVVDDLYEEETNLLKEVTYVNAVDRYFESVHYDFASLETEIESIVNKNGGRLTGLSVDTNLGVALNAETNRYGQIADIMQDLKTEAGMPVTLGNLGMNAKGDGADQSASLGFGLTGTYNLAAKLQKTEKGNSENGTAGNQ